MVFYVVRHGESVGNERRIVQGDDFDPVLTDTGREQAERVGLELRERVGDRVTVHASPTRRTRETASIIADLLATSVTVDECLVEVDPGILAGIAKSLLEECYPAHLATWERRGDLDGVPHAETGDEAQARGLLVLDRLRRSPGDHVLVSHAAFNRYLVNTARGRGRTTPVGHEPTDWSVVADDPLAGVETAPISKGNSGDLRRFRTGEADYVLKRTRGTSHEELAFQAWLSEYVNAKSPTFPTVLAWNVEDGTGTQVLSHETGSHERGPLSESRTRLLVETVADLASLVQQSGREFDVPTLAGRIERTVASASSRAVEVLGRRLLETDVVEGLDDDLTYVHYDLHRGNVLFDDDVTILDLDGTCLGPPTFQPASLFTAGFLLEDVPGFDLDAAIDRWPRPLDRYRLSVLMLARAYVGFEFFVERRSDRRMDDREAELRDRYARAARRILDEFLDWPVPESLTVGGRSDGA